MALEGAFSDDVSLLSKYCPSISELNDNFSIELKSCDEARC